MIRTTNRGVLSHSQVHFGLLEQDLARLSIWCLSPPALRSSQARYTSLFKLVASERIKLFTITCQSFAPQSFIQQTLLPELQQSTFSSYKIYNICNGTTYCHITIRCCDFYAHASFCPGSVSDKVADKTSGLLACLKQHQASAPRRVRLNIPPFVLASLSSNCERAALFMARPSIRG